MFSDVLMASSHIIIMALELRSKPCLPILPLPIVDVPLRASAFEEGRKQRAFWWKVKLLGGKVFWTNLVVENDRWMMNISN